MINKKQLVDDYLKNNCIQITQAKSLPKFKWSDIAKKISQEVEGEYVRGRYRKLNLNTTGFKWESIDKIDTRKSKFNTEEYFQKSIKSIEKDLSNWELKEDFKSGKAESTVVTSQEVKSLEDLIRICNIDTEKWNIDKNIINTWGNPENQMYQVKAFLSAKEGISTFDYKKQFDDFIKDYNVKVLSNPKIETSKLDEPSSELTMLFLSDLHIGNFQKASYVEDISTTIKKSINICCTDKPAEKFTIVNLGDIIHTESTKNQTTRGTQLTASQSHEASFSQALNLLVEIIDHASLHCTTVDFINVRGNHCFDTEYMLGAALKKFYEKNKKVNIINTENVRHYYHWNNNAFLFTHGDKNPNALPLAFATEGNHVFSKAENRFIFSGHLHHNKTKQFLNTQGEFNGVEVRTIGSPSASDKWHTDEGYIGSKKHLTFMMFTPEQGKLAEFQVKI